MSKVIILGAGASHAVAGPKGRLPLTTDLLRELFETRRKEGKSTLRIVFTAIDRFCSGADTHVDAEALLTWLELERNSFIEYALTTDLRKYFHEDLTEALTEILGYCPDRVIPKSDRAFWRFWCEVSLFCFKHYITEYIVDIGRDFDSNLHLALAKTLSPDDTVITFNWDLYLERALSKVAGHSVPSYPVFEWKSWQNVLKMERLLEEKVPRYEEFPKWIKLHGSVDWTVWSTLHHYGRVGRPWLPRHRGRSGRYPPGPQSLFIGVPIALGRELKGEWVEDEEFWILKEPCIIPPLLEKEAYLRRNSMFHELWEAAFYALATADEVVLVGYSIPSTDHRAIWLFRASCLSNPGLKKVRVVDPNRAAICQRLRKENVFPGVPVVEGQESFEIFVS